MNGETLSRTVTIRNPQGLHLRSATTFVKRARRFKCTVTLRRNDQAVDGKSQMELLLLAAEPGARLTLEVAGEDAPAALETLATVIEAETDNGEDAEPGPAPKG
jgi:phosphotransferase system HPr (HPr) family protein